MMIIDKFSEHINDWNNGSLLQDIALKAAIVLLEVGLQKPCQKSKAKDHQECFGNNSHLISSHIKNEPYSASVFVNLVMS